MYDNKHSPDDTYIPDSIKHTNVKTYTIAENKIRFSIRMLDIPGFFETKKRILEMRLYIGQYIIGECLPMPLYFYPHSECCKVEDAIIDHFTEYDDHLRIYFKPQWSLSWEAFTYSKLLFSVYLDAEAHLRHGVHVTFTYHISSRRIISDVKVLKKAKAKEK